MPLKPDKKTSPAISAAEACARVRARVAEAHAARTRGRDADVIPKESDAACRPIHVSKLVLLYR